MIRNARLWCRKSPKGREIESWLRHPTTEILFLSTQQFYCTCNRFINNMYSEGNVRCHPTPGHLVFYSKHMLDSPFSQIHFNAVEFGNKYTSA